MVKATSVKKKLLLFAYGGILLLIMCLLGAIIYFGYSYFGDDTSNESEYEQLFNERKDIALEVAELNEQFSSESEILKVTEDLAQRELLLVKLQGINSQILLNLELMIDIDNGMKELVLIGDALQQSNEIYTSDVTKYNLNKLQRDLIQHQLELNRYYFSDLATDSCFNAIDYNRANREISQAIADCLKLIDKQIEAFNKFGTDLPMTDQYLKNLKLFWEKNRNLYIAIEERNSSVANALDAEVKQLNPLIQTQKGESTNEISTWITSLENEVDQFGN